MPKYKPGQIIKTQRDGMKGYRHNKPTVRVKILKYLPHPSNIASDFKYEYYFCEYPKGIMNLFYIDAESNEYVDPDLSIDECVGYSNSAMSKVAEKFGLKFRDADEDNEDSGKFDVELDESKKVSRKKIEEVTSIVKQLQKLTGKKIVFGERKNINEGVDGMIKNAAIKVKNYLQKVIGDAKSQEGTEDIAMNPALQKMEKLLKYANSISEESDKDYYYSIVEDGEATHRTTAKQSQV